MPSSAHTIISPALNCLMEVDPASVLDVGVGLGKWGLFVREYLESWKGRYHRDQWQVRLEGVEVFEHYIQPFQRALYDEIHVGDATEIVANLPGDYDVVMAMDMIEHQNPEAAAKLMRDCAKKARRAALFSIPLGQAWLAANSIYADINPHEAHRSAWTKETIKSVMGRPARIYYEQPGPRGPIGVFCFQGEAQ